MIHLIWSGKGYLVFVVTFVASLIMELSVEAFYKDDTYYQTNGWPIAWAFVMSAFFVGYLTPRLFKQRKVKDVKTGEIFVLTENHTFFFIHVRHWGLILAGLAFVFYYLVENGKL